MARTTANGNASTERRERMMTRPATTGTLLPGINPMLDDFFSVDPMPARRAASTAAPVEVQPQPMTGAAAPALLAASRIDTPAGPRNAGSLRAGDLVMTADGNAATVLWAGRSVVTLPDTITDLTPVHIAAGALGPDAPRHAVVVAARQTLRLSGAMARFCYGSDETFVPAAEMVNGRSIRQLATGETVSMVHVMIEGMAAICAEHMAVESFQPTPENVAALAPAARADLFAQFPHLKLMVAEPVGRAA